MSETKKTHRVWQAVEDGPAMMVSAEGAFVVGSKHNFIGAHKGGLSLVGESITFGVTGEQIRQGGLFVQMNDFVSMIPSSIVTPIPPEIPWPPLGFITGILQDLPFFFSMMAGTI